MLAAVCAAGLKLGAEHVCHAHAACCGGKLVLGLLGMVDDHDWRQHHMLHVMLSHRVTLTSRHCHQVTPYHLP
jgi:hypothetical protein